jgi:hypothetical protein
MAGRARQTWPDGSVYDGEYHAGRRHGRSAHAWPNGTRYDGGWAGDKMEGRETLTPPAGGGLPKAGTWKAGALLKEKKK